MNVCGHHEDATDEIVLRRGFEREEGILRDEARRFRNIGHKTV